MCVYLCLHLCMFVCLFAGIKLNLCLLSDCYFLYVSVIVVVVVYSATTYKYIYREYVKNSYFVGWQFGRVIQTIFMLFGCCCCCCSRR